MESHQGFHGWYRGWFVCDITRHDSMESCQGQRAWFVSDVKSLNYRKQKANNLCMHAYSDTLSVMPTYAIFSIHMYITLSHHITCDWVSHILVTSARAQQMTLLIKSPSHERRESQCRTDCINPYSLWPDWLQMSIKRWNILAEQYHWYKCVTKII
jgi:hypothetical protein